MLNWLDRLPMLPLAVISILLALAPFVPEPHLSEKVGMLLAGELKKPLDIFDLLMHATPVSLLAIKLYRKLRARS